MPAGELVVPCRVDGCPNYGSEVFGLALAPDDPIYPPRTNDGNICLDHANALWSLIGVPPKRATQVMAEEMCAAINDGADAVIIKMDKRVAGL